MRDRWRHSSSIVFILVLAAGVVPSRAQDIDPSFRDDIMRLMEVTGSAKTAEQMASLVSGQMIEGFRKARPDVPARAFEIAEEVLRAEFADAINGPDGMLAKMIPIYAKYFDHQEVRGLLAFYDTDLGRKTISVMPSLMREGAQVGQAWATESMPRIQKTLEERLEAEGFAE